MDSTSIAKIPFFSTNTNYCGEYRFNVNNSKTRQKRPPKEWIITSIPAIMDAHTFEQIKLKRNSCAPKVMPPQD
jgi:hypothetical protein